MGSINNLSSSYLQPVLNPAFSASTTSAVAPGTDTQQLSPFAQLVNAQQSAAQALSAAQAAIGSSNYGQLYLAAQNAAIASAAANHTTFIAIPTSVLPAPPNSRGIPTAVATTSGWTLVMTPNGLASSNPITTTPDGIQSTLASTASNQAASYNYYAANIAAAAAAGQNTAGMLNQLNNYFGVTPSSATPQATTANAPTVPSATVHASPPTPAPAPAPATVTPAPATIAVPLVNAQQSAAQALSAAQAAIGTSNYGPLYLAAQNAAIASAAANHTTFITIPTSVLPAPRNSPGIPTAVATTSGWTLVMTPNGLASSNPITTTPDGIQSTLASTASNQAASYNYYAANIAAAASAGQNTAGMLTQLNNYFGVTPSSATTTNAPTGPSATGHASAPTPKQKASPDWQHVSHGKTHV